MNNDESTIIDKFRHEIERMHELITQVGAAARRRSKEAQAREAEEDKARQHAHHDDDGGVKGRRLSGGTPRGRQSKDESDEHRNSFKRLVTKGFVSPERDKKTLSEMSDVEREEQEVADELTKLLDSLKHRCQQYVTLSSASHSCEGFGSATDSDGGDAPADCWMQDALRALGLGRELKKKPKIKK